MADPFLVWPRLFDFEMMVLDDALKLNPPPKILKQDQLPTALRWRVHDSLGVPREPFELWRRPLSGTPAPVSLGVPATTVSGQRILEWNRRRLMELRCQAAPNAGFSLTLQALDDFFRPIIGERVTVNTPRAVRLRAPNICALRVTGDGQVSNLQGVTMVALANASDWTLIETVGLPVKANETPGNVYDARPQGRPGAPKPGIDAARDRLDVGFQLYVPPPAAGPGGVPAPTWPAPVPDEVVKEVREEIFPLLQEMLTEVDSDSVDLPQARFRQGVKFPGVRQLGTAVEVQTGRADLQVAGLTLLMAAMDGWTSLALGFGSTDLPTRGGGASDFAEPGRPVMPPFDYRVTAAFRLPFGLKLPIAALAGPPRFPVLAPQPLTAVTARRHRPLILDGPASADVELRWARAPGPVPPHGYAAGVLTAGAAPAEVLNERRLGTGFVPYLAAQRPDGDLDNEARAHLVANARPAPLIGSREDTYLCAAVDVFGRWSQWTSVKHSVEAEGPGPPRVLEARLVMGVQNGPRSLAAELHVELVWDWQDRRPEAIELRGAFFPAGGAPPAAAPAGVQAVPGGAPGSPEVLAYDGADSIIDPPGDGVDAAGLPPEPEDGDSRRYRVILRGFSADFGAGPRLAYALYARAREQVNPGLFSAFTTPVVARASDPLPPGPQPLARDVPIHWAALPDATGLARARFTCPAADHAAGYVIYEASEAALFRRAGLDPPADRDLQVRANALGAFVDIPACRDAFSRVNVAPLPNPDMEVAVPGGVDGLFAYTIAGLTTEQVEGPRSPALLVAVPRRITPAAPRVRARVLEVLPQVGDAPGVVRVAVRVESGGDPPPAAVELYRTGARSLSADENLMGPPVALPTDPRWIVEDTDGDGIPERFLLEDTFTASWRPLFYRAIGLGPDDRANGRLPGRSRPSAAIEVLAPPIVPPDLQPPGQQFLTGGLVRVRFRSRAEVRPSTLGVHQLEVFTVDRSTPLPTPHLHAGLPQQDVPPTPTPSAPAAGTLTRGAVADAAGRFLYEAFVPAGEEELLLRLTDPLGRQSEQRAPLATEPPPPRPPDLVDLRVRRQLAQVLVSVRSSVPTRRPLARAFVLELIDPTPTEQLLARALVHEIRTTPVSNAWFRSDLPDVERRHTYQIRLTGALLLDQVLVRLTDPDGLRSELRRSL